jgi:dephospho-CoA kinase
MASSDDRPAGTRDRLVIGLTGGIASGKSTVSAAFAAAGAAIVDTDLIAREVVAPGSEALAEIVVEFGASVLSGDGSLDRKRLRAIVFAQPQARLRLEAILHPRIRSEALAQVQVAHGPYVVLVVPLLVENAKHYSWVDRVLVVDVSGELQQRLLMARDDIGDELAAAMIAAQASRSARLALADDVIRNSGSVADLHTQVGNADRRYRALAAT